LLDPQPPTPETLAERASGAQRESDSACPFCGQAKRRGRPRGVGRRLRKTWPVKVPDDSEDGADVLDVLVEDLALILGYDPSASARYYVLAAALAYVHQDKARFIESLAGTGA